MALICGGFVFIILFVIAALVIGFALSNDKTRKPAIIGAGVIGGAVLLLILVGGVIVAISLAAS